MRATQILNDVVRAIGFLSRIPVPPRYFEGRTTVISDLVYVFPVAGALIALPGAVVLALLMSFGLEPTPSALIGIAVTTLVTGALHEDGLSDTADGIGGGRDREKALAIMRDSRIGSYGALALILSVAIRAATLAAIAVATGPLAAGLALMAVAAASRGAMVWHWLSLPPARRDGVAVSSGQPDDSVVHLAMAVGAAIVLALVIPTAGFGAGLSLLVATGLAAWALTRYIRVRLGGHTGDTIGATEQTAEMAALLALALAT